MVFLAFLSSLAFIFLGKSYAKKENATLKKAVLRAFLWSLVLCWSYVVLETVGMPGHVVGSMKVPWLAATFMSIAFNYTFTPGLILSPVIPIALYTLTFYAVNTESIDTKKIIISCIKSVCIYCFVIPADTVFEL